MSCFLPAYPTLTTKRPQEMAKVEPQRGPYPLLHVKANLTPLPPTSPINPQVAVRIRAEAHHLPGAHPKQGRSASPGLQAQRRPYRSGSSLANRRSSKHSGGITLPVSRSGHGCGCRSRYAQPRCGCRASHAGLGVRRGAGGGGGWSHGSGGGDCCSAAWGIGARMPDDVDEGDRQHRGSPDGGQVPQDQAGQRRVQSKGVSGGGGRGGDAA